MSRVLDVDVALQAPQIPAAHERVDTAQTLEEIIAAHRQALVDLAPHQAKRSVREDTAWHITQLGLLLRVRDSAGGAPVEHPALASLRAGQAARVQAGMAYREAGQDPVEVLTTLLPLPADEIPREQTENPAPSGVHLPERGRTRENTGTDHLAH